MQFLSISEGSTTLGLGPVESFVAEVADQLVDSAGFEIPTDSCRKSALAQLISKLAPSKPPVLLWVTGWGVWPSCENWDLFYGYRRSLGETRQLIDAPLHVFTSTDQPALASMVSLVLFFGWDAHVVSITGDFMLTISHDEWFELQLPCQADGSEAIGEIDRFGLRRIGMGVGS